MTKPRVYRLTNRRTGETFQVIGRENARRIQRENKGLYQSSEYTVRLQTELERAEQERRAPNLSGARGHKGQEPKKPRPVIRGGFMKVLQGSEFHIVIENVKDNRVVSHTFSLSDPNVQTELEENGIHIPERLPVQRWIEESGTPPDSDLADAAKVLMHDWFATDVSGAGGYDKMEWGFRLIGYRIFNRTINEAIRSSGGPGLRRIYSVK